MFCYSSSPGVVCVIWDALTGSQWAALGEHPPALQRDTPRLPPRVASPSHGKDPLIYKPSAKLGWDGRWMQFGICGGQEQLCFGNGFQKGCNSSEHLCRPSDPTKKPSHPSALSQRPPRAEQSFKTEWEALIGLQQLTTSHPAGLVEGFL